MKSSPFITRSLRFALLLAASACGGPAPSEKPVESQPVPVESQTPPPEEQKPPREPLVTLQVTMSPAPGVTFDKPVRLAMGWYPNLFGQEDVYRFSQPVAIVEDLVVFQGTASADFEFRVFAPPPEAAMLPVNEKGVTTKAAMGVLLAYEDLNGNGKLDTIPIAGAPIDRVVGTSLRYWQTSEEWWDYAALYMEAAVPEWDIRQGFNLLELSASNGPVPLSTRIPIQLVAGGPDFDAFVCEGAWNQKNPPSANQCGLSFAP